MPKNEEKVPKPLSIFSQLPNASPKKDEQQKKLILDKDYLTKLSDAISSQSTFMDEKDDKNRTAISQQETSVQHTKLLTKQMTEIVMGVICAGSFITAERTGRGDVVKHQQAIEKVYTFSQFLGYMSGHELAQQQFHISQNFCAKMGAQFMRELLKHQEIISGETPTHLLTLYLTEYEKPDRQKIIRKANHAVVLINCPLIWPKDVLTDTSLFNGIPVSISELLTREFSQAVLYSPPDKEGKKTLYLGKEIHDYLSYYKDSARIQWHVHAYSNTQPSVEDFLYGQTAFKNLILQFTDLFNQGNYDALIGQIETAIRNEITRLSDQTIQRLREFLPPHLGSLFADAVSYWRDRINKIIDDHLLDTTLDKLHLDFISDSTLESFSFRP